MLKRVGTLEKIIHTPVCKQNMFKETSSIFFPKLQRKKKMNKQVFKKQNRPHVYYPWLKCSVLVRIHEFSFAVIDPKIATGGA